MIQKRMQRGLRLITYSAYKEKSNIAITILKNEWLDGTIIISYFNGSNNIFADCTLSIEGLVSFYIDTG